MAHDPRVHGLRHLESRQDREQGRDVEEIRRACEIAPGRIQGQEICEEVDEGGVGVKPPYNLIANIGELVVYSLALVGLISIFAWLTNH